MKAEIINSKGMSVARVRAKEGGVSISVGIGATEETQLSADHALELMWAIFEIINANAAKEIK